VHSSLTVTQHLAWAARKPSCFLVLQTFPGDANFNLGERSIRICIIAATSKALSPISLGFPAAVVRIVF
jgi:hypothetical protein